MTKKQRTINKIRESYNRGEHIILRIYPDASGMECEYRDPYGDHGLPCQISTSLSLEDAIKVLAGMRLTIAPIPTTLKIEKQ